MLVLMSVQQSALMSVLNLESKLVRRLALTWAHWLVQKLG